MAISRSCLPLAASQTTITCAEGPEAPGTTLPQASNLPSGENRASVYVAVFLAQKPSTPVSPKVPEENSAPARQDQRASRQARRPANCLLTARTNPPKIAAKRPRGTGDAASGHQKRPTLRTSARHPSLAADGNQNLSVWRKRQAINRRPLLQTQSSKTRHRDAGQWVAVPVLCACSAPSCRCEMPGCPEKAGHVTPPKIKATNAIGAKPTFANPARRPGRANRRIPRFAAKDIPRQAQA